MKTLELYVAILKKVRFETLEKGDDLKLGNFDTDSPTYKAICIINEAANDLSSLIDIMKQELSIIKEETK
jgi:hypothetical protein